MFRTYDSRGTEDDNESNRLNATFRVTVSVKVSASPWKYLNISRSINAITHSVTAYFMYARAYVCMLVMIVYCVSALVWAC